MYGMNRKAIVQRVHDLYGVVENSVAGRARGAAAVQAAVAYMYSNLPDRLLMRDFVLATEPPISKGQTGSPSGGSYATFHVDPDDTKVLIYDGNAADFPLDGTRDGRWIEVYDTVSAQWVQRRVRRFAAAIEGLGTTTAFVVLDEPWIRSTDTDLNWRLFTMEYPYPVEMARLVNAWWSPYDGRGRPLDPLLPQEIQRIALQGGWRVQGPPSRAGTGATFQLPPPHATPQVEVVKTIGSKLWGYANGTVEHGSTFAGERYNAAGTFIYYACLGWGRRLHYHPAAGRGVVMPWYLSPPSLPSEPVTTTWGEGLIRVTMPDVSYIYGFNTDSTKRSFNNSGLDWWIFRARTATEDPTSASNHAHAKVVENDSVPYMLTPISVEAMPLEDAGQYNPDRLLVLPDMASQPSIMLDTLPNEVATVLLKGIPRVRPLEHDTDVPPVPADLIDGLLLPLVAAFLVSKRANDPMTESVYFKQYIEGVSRLTENEAVMAPGPVTMGNALGASGIVSPYRNSLMSTIFTAN